jgi:predicted AAA+ superfamily ATPase
MARQPRESSPLFPAMRLPAELVDDLRRLNPWWEGKAMRPPPRTRRHLVEAIHRRLDRDLAPAVVVRGPRQIGKTTAQLQVIADLLEAGWRGNHVLRVQFDELPSLRSLQEPLLRIVDWFEANVLGATLNEAATAGRPTLLVFDEVQNVDRWAEQLKALVDASKTRVLVTGSSALRIERGRESLAGRITTVEAGVLSLTEVAEFRDIPLGAPFLSDNGIEPLGDAGFWERLAEHGRALRGPRDLAFAQFARRGGYPLAHAAADVPWAELADQLNETVIRRVIQHDLPRIGEKGRRRDPELLAEVFRLACRYAGMAPTVQVFARETQRALAANVGSQKIRGYLRLLGDSLLLRLIEPLEIRLKKRRGADKICLADHALRASWLHEQVPLDPEELAAAPHLAPLAGHLAESAVGACLATIGGLDINHFPERSDQPEIDFILTIGARRIPMEVKYQRQIDPLRDTEGLRSFLEKSANNASFGVLVTQTDDTRVEDPRIHCLPLSSLLLLR